MSLQLGSIVDAVAVNMHDSVALEVAEPRLLRHVLTCMRLFALALAAWLPVAPAFAQDAKPSSGGAGAPAVSSNQPAASEAEQKPARDLPVSLDRVRQGLARPAGTGLKNLDIKSDFIVRVEEREHIQAILSKLEVRKAFVPSGGLYAYEQQQQLSNKTDRPLQQPYAAFSGGELITLAIEGLMQRYLGGKIVNGISNAQRASAEREARQEVAQAIAEYCDARPDGGQSLHLCTEVLER